MCDEVHHFILVPSLKDLCERLGIWVPGQMKFGAWVQAMVVHREDQTKEFEDVDIVPRCWTHEVCFSSFTCFQWTWESCLYKWGGQRLTFLHVYVCTCLCIVGNDVQLHMCTHVDAICQLDICDCLPLFLRQDLSLNLEPAWLPGKLQGSTSFYPQHATTANFFMGAGDCAELLRFVSSALYQMNHLPAPCETISMLPSLKERHDRVADRAVP